MALSAGIITALQLFGTAFTAISAVQQGKAQEAQLEFQAGVQEQQAATARQQADRDRQVAAINESDARRESSRTFAARRAALGAAGIEQSTGSPLLAVSDFATEAELQALRIRAGGETDALRKEQEADILSQSAGFSRSGARNARSQGFVRAGASLLQGAGVAFG